MVDNYRHKGLRRQLINALRDKGISNEEVLEAMDRIPRHLFLDNAFLEFAYDDRAFPIGEGQTISHPYTVAFQTQLLDVQKGMKVLEIGTGSGYQTAVLCELGCKVFSIERQKKLYDKTKRLLGQMDYRPRLFYGDGYQGKSTFGPFDRVIVTCGAPFVPEQLLTQMTGEGRMVIPVGSSVQKMKLITKNSEGGWHEGAHGNFQFVPMLEDRNR